MPLAQRHADARKQTWHDAAVAIWKHGAQQNAAGVGIDTVVERLEVTAMREVLFVGQLQFDRNPAVAVGLKLPGLGQCIKLQQRVLVDVRIRVDWIHRNQSRQQRGRSRDAADVIALGQERAADASVNRRADLRVFEVEFRGVERRLRRLQRRPGFLIARLAGVGFFR